MLLIKIKDAEEILSEIILHAKKQGAKNFDMLYFLQDALQELKQKTQNRQMIDQQFLNKWDNIIGWIPRVFEGHPLLDLIRDIDKMIFDDNSR